jgi:Ca2+-binding RTX toxin-like protein
VVDLSALREGGFGDVTISLGPLRATDGGGDGIGSVALAGDALVFTAAAGAEGRAGSVDVTLVDALGQVGGATVALDVAEAPEDGGGGSPPIAPEPQPEPDSGDDDDGGDGGPDIPASPGNDPEDRTPDTPAPPEAETGRVLLRGTEGRDRIFGTAADERFEGLGARDVLVSGGGDDLMIGGDGPDFFAFARIDAPGRTEVEDFGPQDFLVLDDRFFGLGDATIDLRGVTLEQVLTAVRAGLVALDREAGTLSIDPGRDARGDDPELTITLGDGLADLGVADVFLV